MSHRCLRLAIFAAICGVLAIAGCTDVSRATVESMQLAWRGQPMIAPTAAQVAAKPYFQMRATTAKGDAVLVLGNIDGQRELWYGTQGVVVVLQGGRVVQTIGLDQNLDGSRVTAARDPFLLGLHTLKSPLTYQREEDWSPGYRYGIAVRAELVPAGSADIEILGSRHHTLLVTEDALGKNADFHATNRYWVDPADGFVWKSEQHVMPGLTLTLVQFRPHRGTKP
jgi:hypothetical protein